MKGEIWKDIEGYEGLYQVSNMGRVRSVERTVRNGKGYRIIPEKILKPYDNGHGYLQVKLHKDGNKKQPLVHVLVATAFLGNADNLPEVNHKDENKYNNCIENLEYCSRQYNMEYSLAKAIIGIDKVSGLIVEFPSAYEASRQTGITRSHICECCNGKAKSAGGFYWFYVDDDDDE